MFSRSKRSQESAKAPPKSPSTPSIISRDLRIIGDIITDGDVQIDGIIEGDVNSGSVTVGEHAVVKGCIRAQLARVRGRVDGEIYARNVALARTAKVQGDIMHESISIEAGAYLDGRCRRIEDETLKLGGPEDVKALSGPSGSGDDDAKANPFAMGPPADSDADGAAAKSGKGKSASQDKAAEAREKATVSG